MSGCLPSSEARLTTYEIEDAPEVKTAQNYYSDYLSWKSKVYRETGLYYKPFAIREVTIICGFCWPT